MLILSACMVVAMQTVSCNAHTSALWIQCIQWIITREYGVVGCVCADLWSGGCGSARNMCMVAKHARRQRSFYVPCVGGASGPGQTPPTGHLVTPMRCRHSRSFSWQRLPHARSGYGGSSHRSGSSSAAAARSASTDAASAAAAAAAATTADPTAAGATCCSTRIHTSIRGDEC